jgi:hypothetical protein
MDPSLQRACMKAFGNTASLGLIALPACHPFLLSSAHPRRTLELRFIVEVLSAREISSRPTWSATRRLFAPLLFRQQVFFAEVATVPASV